MNRDVAPFDQRAAGYDRGWLGRMHHDIVERCVAIALAAHPEPRSVLDVGCGTGHLLRVIAERCPETHWLNGIDPAVSMVSEAREVTSDPRVVFAEGVVEELPYRDEQFDLVVSTTSFDHWSDQQAGLAECARVLASDGHIVVADLFSPWLLPTLIGSRKEKARTRPRANRLLAKAGLNLVRWYHVMPLLGAFVADR
jgi:ubiquinone/menaquinone biosynthesis C-methylase UbiE